MVIDGTISIGNLLTVVTVIVAIVLFLSRFRTDISVIVAKSEATTKELEAIREEVRHLAMVADKISAVLIEVATQRTRLDGIDRRIDDGVAVRQRMQADLEARFNGLEERLRGVEGLAHVGGGKMIGKKRKAT